MAEVIGIDVYVEVNTGTEASPVWTKVGGQRGATLTLNVDTAEITDKDSQGWREYLPTLKSWTLEFENFYIDDDAGVLELRNAFLNKEKKQVRLKTANETYTGYAYVTSFPVEAPLDDVVTISFSLQGTGPLTIA